MKGLQRRARSALAALLLASLVLSAVPAAPAAASPADGASVVAWLAAWLTRLVPGWTTADSESQEEPPPSEDGIVFDDEFGVESCNPTTPSTCAEGDRLPDFDPDG